MEMRSSVRAKVMTFLLFCLRNGCVLLGFVRSVLHDGQLLDSAVMRFVWHFLQCGLFDRSLPGMFVFRR